MPAISANFVPANFRGSLNDYLRFMVQRAEDAALKSTDRAARIAKARIRTEMGSARLGTLGNAFAAKSDLDRGGIQVRYGGNGGFAASGIVYVRTKSERTLGAIQAYTEGADIRPVRSNWLWIPSKDIQRLVGTGRNRRRLSPGLWNESGLESRIGPLEMIESVNGYPLLVVKTGAVAMTGKARSLRGRLKSGRAPKGFQNRDFIVAFIGIPFTSRTARVDVQKIIDEVRAELPQMFIEALGRI